MRTSACGRAMPRHRNAGARPVLRSVVLHHRITRRQAVRAGAAGTAALWLGRVRAAGAAPGTGLFELALGDDAVTATAAGWRRSPVLRAPRRFDMAGLRWTSGDLEAEIRARRRGGPWGPWLALHAIADHAPDGTRAHRGTDPAYTGAADLLQLRLRGAAHGVRVRFVRAQPAARTARIAQAGRRRQLPAGAPRIIPRAEWGAAAVPPRDAPRFGSVELAFVHHTVGRTDYAPHESAGIVLGIARFHRDGNGWDDVGYNFLVDRHGQVFEGRAGGIDQAVIGAQAQGYNAVSTGIACIGTFQAVTQTEAGMDALARLIAWKLALHGVPALGAVTVTSAGGSANRFPSGTPVTLQRISGHRDADRTTCPGDALYGQLADLRARVAAYLQPLPGLVSMRVDSGPRVRHPNPVALSGFLRPPDGGSPEGRPIQIEFQAGDAPWQAIGATAADGAGGWRVAVALPAGGELRAVHPGPVRIESPKTSVAVIPRLTLALGATRAPAGQAVAVSGTFGPYLVAPRADVVVERRVGARWVRVQRKRVNVRGGRFTTAIRPRRAGLYRVSVGVGGAVARRRLRFTTR